MSIKNNKLFVSLLSLGLVLLVTGISYAFFMYSKTGLYTHTINGGKMKVIYDETTRNNITIDNAYPLTDTEALAESLEFEFTITGYNESEKNVYYQIEIDHGQDITGKNRFLDSDMKLTLYENDKLVIENERYQNLDNQSIYYSYIRYGTSVDDPVVNNYKLKIWINDDVLISNTIENDINLWDDIDFQWLESQYGSLEVAFEEYCGDSDTCYLSDFGKNVYTTADFANSYANFKVNVIANLKYSDVDYLTYDANGGEFTPKKTSLTTNMVTSQKPVMEGKGFVGWSSDPNASEAEYKTGEYYNGEAKLLYAIYNDTRNVMGTFPNSIVTENPGAVEMSNDYDSSVIDYILFINETSENIDERYEQAEIKADLTYNDQGSVKCWVEPFIEDPNYTALYVASEGTIYLTDCEEMFVGFTNCVWIDLTNVDTSMVENMSGMFAVSSKSGGGVPMNNELLLRENNSSNPTFITSRYENLYVDFSILNTSNVKDMSYMFNYCLSLMELDLSSFDTSKVTNMENMFYYCRSLMNLNIDNFDTSKVTDMSGMFAHCQDLLSLDLSHFNTENVTDMRCMFYECTNIESLNLSSFDTRNVTDMRCMFQYCCNLVELDISNFDTSNVTDMSYMFIGCYDLPKLNLRHFNTSNVTNMHEMFYRCRNLTYLNISNFDTSNVEDMSCMFMECISLFEFDLSNFDTKNVTTMSQMFYECNSLKSVDLSSFNTSNVTSMYGMFSKCSSLETLDLCYFDVSKVTDMSVMFAECNGLKTLDLSGWNLNSLTFIGSYRGNGIFHGCSSLTILDISSFDFDTITDYTYAFYGMNSNATIYVGDTNDQTLILGISTSYRPSNWSTNNVIVKNA